MKVRWATVYRRFSDRYCHTLRRVLRGEASATFVVARYRHHGRIGGSLRTGPQTIPVMVSA